MELESYIQTKQFEEKICNCIIQYLSEDETVTYDYRLKRENSAFIADLHFGKGCKALSWPQNTIVEVKSTLRDITVMRIIQYLESFVEQGMVGKVVLVCNTRITTSRSTTRLENYKWLSIYDENDLKQFLKNTNKPLYKLNNIPEVDVIDKAKDSYEHERYSLFLGAGLSRSANLPDWNELLEALLVQKDGRPYSEINEENSKSISKVFSNSAIITGRYAFDGYRKAVEKALKDSREKFKTEIDRKKRIEDETNELIVDRIRDILYKNVKQSELVSAVCNAMKVVHPSQVITYNYDSLVEDELDDSATFVSVYDKNIPRGKVVPIYHVHGMISKNERIPSFPVLSEKEYHEQYMNNASWSNVSQLHALNSSSCFFIGLSMTDPNLRRLLDFARYEERNSDAMDRLPHYVFLKRDRLEGEASRSVNDEHWDEMEQMMNSFGLNVIWFKKFSDLPLIIDYISAMIR